MRFHPAVAERRFLVGGYINLGIQALLPGLWSLPPLASTPTSLASLELTPPAGSARSQCQLMRVFERTRAEALWRIVRQQDSGSVTKEAAVGAFFSNNEGMAGFWCDHPLAYQDVGRDREGSMERDCPGRTSDSDSDF